MDEVRYREEQWFPYFVTVLAAGAAAGTVVALAALPWARWARSLLGPAASVLGITALVAPMRTCVDAEGVTVTFGLPEWIRFRIAADQVRSVEPVTYRPLAEFGGWGIRFGRGGTRAYTARGNRGVRIHTASREYVVGSQDPEALAGALRQVAGI